MYVYIYIYILWHLPEKTWNPFYLQKYCSHVNCALYFSFVFSVCEHGTKHPSYHHKLGIWFSKATNLKGMSLGSSQAVTLSFVHLVSSPSYGWNCSQLKQPRQESQAGKGSCLPQEKGSSRPKQVSSGRYFVYIPHSVVWGSWEFPSTEFHKHMPTCHQMQVIQEGVLWCPLWPVLLSHSTIFKQHVSDVSDASGKQQFL